MAKQKITPPNDGADPGPDEEVEATPPPKAKASEQQPAKPKHSARLIAEAAKRGYSESDLEDYDAATIWEELNRIDELEAKKKAPAPVPQKKQSDESQDDDEAYLAALEAEGYTKTVIAAERKKLARLKAAEEKAARLEALEAAEKSRSARQVNDIIDAGFASLPKKFHTIFGEESFADLDPGQRAWRNEVLQKAGVDLSKDSQKTINRKIAEAAQKAAKGKVPDDEPEEDAYEIPAKKKPKSRLSEEDFENGQLLKPSGKKGGLNGVDLHEGVRRIMKENGMPGGNRSVIEMDDDDLPE